MKKTVLCLLLCLLLLPLRGIAEASDSTEFDLKALAEDTVFLVNANDPSHAVLGLERNADKKRYPASTTKIMTCILALEKCEPDEIVLVGKRAAKLSDRNSKMGIIPGESYRMIDLLYGLMLLSGNDAAIAIAEHVGGSIEGFSDLMNEKAGSLGMTGTHYVNPHGLHNADHYTTARDTALLAAYAMENETFRTIVRTTELTVRSTDGRKITVQNSNRMLRDKKVNSYKPYSCLYPDAIGIKTGDTNLAGKCLVAAAKRGDTTYIAVLLHGENAPENLKGRDKDLYSAQRFYDAAKLFDYVFAHDTVEIDAGYLSDRCLPDTYAYTPDPKETPIREALYRIEWSDASVLVLPRWQADSLIADPFPEDYIRYSAPDLSAPLGAKAGTVAVTVGENVLLTGDLIAEDYTYAPTPAPTAEPTYTVIEETPQASSPSPSPEPVSLPEATPEPTPAWIPVSPEATSDPKSCSWFRCVP